MRAGRREGLTGAEHPWLQREERAKLAVIYEGLATTRFGTRKLKRTLTFHCQEIPSPETREKSGRQFDNVEVACDGARVRRAREKRGRFGVR